MARRRGPRGLHAEEEALWRKIARQTNPLHPERRPPLPETPRDERVAPDAPKPDLTDFGIGARPSAASMRNGVRHPPTGRVAQPPIRMDAKAFGRMKRGKLAIEARLDLHGLTLAEAHPRLTFFVLDAHAAGKRLVLVITGKGRDRDDGGPIPARGGALRRQVPLWLAAPPLGSVVLQVTAAHPSHGGSGAFYAYLRRAGK